MPSPGTTAIRATDTSISSPHTNVVPGNGRTWVPCRGTRVPLFGRVRRPVAGSPAPHRYCCVPHRKCTAFPHGILSPALYGGKGRPTATTIYYRHSGGKGVTC